jgi:hypothetical protein
MSRIPNKVCHTMLASMWQFIRVFEFSSPSSESLQVSGVMEFKLVAVRHQARSKPWPSDGCVRSYRNRAVMVPSYFRLRQATTPRPLPAPAQLGYIGPGHEPSFHQKKKALGGRAAVRCRGSTSTFGFERLTVQLLDNVFLFTTKCLEL